MSLKSVRREQINRILSSIKASLNHPLFFPRVFALVAKNRLKEKTNSISAIIKEEFDEFSRLLDRSQIQDSCSVRNVLRVRRLAYILIDDKGELDMALLSEAIQKMKSYLYSLGPHRQYDAKRQEHILKILEVLYSQKELVRLFKKISRPFSNKHAEELIRQTLDLSAATIVTDAHTRRAVLAAWLSYLRQNVGSCFATAPAKVVQEEQPELFLQDMADLLATSRLKRTFGGIEYSVPLSISWGVGDLKKPILINFSSNHIQPEIWFSPGLIAAFEAIHFFKPETSMKAKVLQIKDWLMPLIQQRGNWQTYKVLTAEEMIRFILLQVFGLTEQQLKDYGNRSRGMVQSQLLVQIPISAKTSGGIGERCANFLQQFEVAKNAFKALSDSALLKAWEFTLASFSETKLEFTRWNLYSSLGMRTEEPGGIGQCIYQIVQRKLDMINAKVQDIQYEYEMVFTQVKTLESRMRQASTEQELQWLKVEYQSRANEFYFLEEQRDKAQYQARNLVGLYESLYTLYLELFKDYFQEVYDADMQEVVTGPFDDSPAGFRLLYKHGRSNTAQWTRIKNQHEFIDALTSFFVATEPQIVANLELKKGLEKDLSEVVTAIINHIKTKEFLESAFHRMAAAHNVPLIKNPLDHLDEVEKKPWVYTSGGTMDTLVSCYYRLVEKPKEEAKWVESELELLVFLAETLKRIPYSLMEPYLKKSRASMLMQSPTHAFLLKPNLPLFKEAWATDEFTYTYVRDRFLKPAEMFVEQLLLNDEMIQFILHKLMEKVPENFQPRFKAAFSSLSGPINPIFFREYLIDMLVRDRGLRLNRSSVLAAEEIDSFLYSHLPLFSNDELRDRISKILILIPGIDSNKAQEILLLLDRIPFSREIKMISANQLQDICKALLCLVELDTGSPYDYHLAISQAAQKLGFAMPTPLIFADTNWVKEEFGFVVNPGTGKFELWRLDYTGSFGYPMTTWEQWLNGSQPNQKWGVYVKPIEYGQN